MICDLCNKNKAVIHIEKHAGSNRTQLKVCCECAGLEGLSPENLNGESLQKLISGINLMQKAGQDIVCENCGMDAETFSNGGKLGCSACYTHLKSVIDMSSWQKTTHYKHIGKTPYSFDVTPDHLDEKFEDIQSLEDKLVISISQENYEEAAVLRDRIEEMKKATP